MKNIPILFLCSIFLLLSCLKEEPVDMEPITYTINDLEEYGYFPLHVGNEWDFIRGDKVRIDSIVTIEGKEYFRFVGEGNESWPTYYRQEGNLIFEREGDLPEILRYDLGAKVDDTWYYDDPWNAVRKVTAFLVSKTEIVQTENFEFQNCYNYYYYIPHLSDSSIDIFLAKGIGFFRSWAGTRNDRGLLRVKIDGKEVFFE